MLFSFRSSNLSWALIIALVRDDRRREADAVWRGPRVAITLGLGETRLAAGGKLLGTDDPEWFKAGGGSALGAFPMPLGSLTELLRPPALPGPFGIPLTPASAAPCANDCTGDIKQPAHARAKNVDFPNIGHSPVRVSNEATGLPFPVRMRPNAGHGLPFSRKLIMCTGGGIAAFGTIGVSARLEPIGRAEPVRRSPCRYRMPDRRSDNAGSRLS